MFAGREPMHERAYREYYLDADIRRASIIIFTIVSSMAFLLIVDALSLQTNPGIVISVVIGATALFLIWLMNSVRRPLVLDCCMFLFSMGVTLGIIAFHVNHDSSSMRVIIVVFSTVYLLFAVWPVYASNSVIPWFILVIGEGYLLFNSSNLVLPIERIPFERTMIIQYVLYVSLMSIFSSVYHQRSRYLFFRAISQVKQLSGLLPICSGCKKIRDDDGYFQQIEHYISEHSEAEFSQAYCSDCAETLFPELTLSGE